MKPNAPFTALERQVQLCTTAIVLIVWLALAPDRVMATDIPLVDPALTELDNSAPLTELQDAASEPHDVAPLTDPHNSGLSSDKTSDTTETEIDRETDSTPVAPNIDLKKVAPVPQVATHQAPEKTPNPAPQNSDIDAEATRTQTSKTSTAETQPDSTDASVQSITQPVTQPVTTTPPSTGPAKVSPPPREKLVILGAEVPPGTSTRLAWSPGDAIAGLTLPTPVLVVNGSEPGGTLCLTAAIHGDELNGIEIVRRVIYDLDPDKLFGTVIGVPIVNLQGFQRGSRYLTDRRDLNRYFPGDAEGSLASRMAHSLFDEVIQHCDMLVDLHTGSLRRTNLVQVRADMRYSNVSEFTQGFDKTVIVHSTGSEGMLRHAAVAYGITAVTLEIGESLRLQLDQVKRGASGILSLLHRLDMYPRLFTWGEPEPVYYQSNWIRAKRGGILFSKVHLGDIIAPGDILGTVTDPITNESTHIVAEAKGQIIGMAVNQVVMPGFAAYHVGIDAPEDSLFSEDELVASIDHHNKKRLEKELVSED